MKKLLFFASAAALLLGACSQDMTEDLAVAAPSVAGDDIIIAAQETDAATRSHLNENRKFDWDSGDALGVFAAQTGNAVNAYFGYQGKNEKNEAYFKGDLKSIKVTANENDEYEYMAYYPWRSGTTLANGTLTFEIPKTQYYNHVNADGYGSFAPGTVPAVAKTSISKDADKSEVTLDFTFQPVVSYIGVPIKGNGTVESVKLQFKKNGPGPGNSIYKFFGTVAVDMFHGTPIAPEVSEDAPEDAEPTEPAEPVYDTFFTITNTTENTDITLDCGDGVSLSMTEKWFVFVVPANMEITAKSTFVITVKGSTGTTQTYEYTPGINDTTGRNAYVRLSRNNPFVFDEENRYLVETPAQFMEYAYVATKGVEEGVVPANHDMLDGEKLKAAYIIKDLEFDEKLYEAAEGATDFQKAVAEWCENGMPTMGGKLAFDIVGATGEDSKGAATITGLNTKQALFAAQLKAEADKDKPAGAVENIVLSGTKTTAAFFLMDRYYSTSTTFTDVTVEGEYTMPLFNQVYTTYLESGVVKPETMLYANNLYVNQKEVWFTGEGAIPVVDFKTVHTHDSGIGAVMHVADEAEANALIARVKVDKPEPDGGHWYSVVDDTASHWTGTVAKSLIEDDYFTAEELAYVAANGGEAELNLDIDLGYGSNNNKYFFNGSKEAKEWKTGENEVTIVGNDKNIYRADVSNGLFGAKATVSDLTIYNSHQRGQYLLAKTGTASGVTATKLINYKNNTAVAGDVVGGLFYEVDIEDVVKAEATANSFKPSNVTEGVKVGNEYAVMNVCLGDTYTLPAYFDAASVGVYNCYAAKEGHSHTAQITTIEYAGNNAPNVDKDKGGDPSIVRWDTSNGSIASEYTVFFTNAADNGANTTNYVTYDGTISDSASIKDAFANATDNSTITIAKGTYDAKDLELTKNGKLTEQKNVTIDFNGAEIEFNGGNGGNPLYFGENNTIKNAKINNRNAGYTFISGNFVDCVFEGDGGAGLTMAYVPSNTTITFTRCKFIAEGENGHRAAYIAEDEGVTANFDDCDFTGYCPFSGKPTLSFKNCRFEANTNGFAGVGVRGDVTFDTCTFTMAAPYYDHRDIAIKASGKSYVFTNCTVNGEAFNPKAEYVTVDELLEVTVNGIKDALSATEKKGKIPTVGFDY